MPTVSLIFVCYNFLIHTNLIFYIQVTTSSLRCCLWLLKYPLPSLKTHIKPVTNSLFVLLNNYASPGAAKEGTENFELIMTCFKVKNKNTTWTHWIFISWKHLEVCFESHNVIHTWGENYCYVTESKCVSKLCTSCLTGGNKSCERHSVSQYRLETAASVAWLCRARYPWLHQTSYSLFLTEGKSYVHLLQILPQENDAFLFWK